MDYKGRIFICADLHGDPRVIQQVIAKIENPTKDDVIIVAGDAGFEYGTYSMGSAKRAARKFPGHWIVMRGNHDNCYVKRHTYNGVLMNGWSFYGNQNEYIYQNKYPNILYVSDLGGIYFIKGLNFLFLPGAYSVDKNFRLRNNYPYNPEEQLSKDDMLKMIVLVDDWNKQNFPIDYVIGHTFPKWLEPRYEDLFMSGLNQSEIDKTTEMWLGEMSELFERNYAFKQYFGGHFHDSRWLTDKYRMVYHDPIEIG